MATAHPPAEGAPSNTVHAALDAMLAHAQGTSEAVHAELARLERLLAEAATSNESLQQQGRDLSHQLRNAIMALLYENRGRQVAEARLAAFAAREAKLLADKEEILRTREQLRRDGDYLARKLERMGRDIQAVAEYYEQMGRGPPAQITPSAEANNAIANAHPGHNSSESNNWATFNLVPVLPGGFTAQNTAQDFVESLRT
ncbi:hypothetical protein MVEN_01111300 [Mycena venus]|uniref:Uncharacterized protein n=1 Tax=Mycena venus TaxID=2733690 RepID=A0A8H7CXS7_9AGAR|nr:hypothetical protein MVEN_01111300 [Mycena venus]